MNARDLIFALGGLALLGAGAIIGLTSGESPEPMPGGATDARPAEAPTPPLPELQAPAAAPTMRAGDGDPATPTEVRSQGLVRGHVTLTQGMPRNLTSVIISIVERGDAIDARPLHTRVPIDVSEGSPRFAIDGIPFSENEYSARVFAEGLNGSEQTFRVTETRPIADIVLGLSIGAYLSVVLRDQERAAVVDLPVQLIPIDEPAGRPVRQAVANNFGSAQFESLLRGKYKVVVGQLSAPLNTESIIEVAGDLRIQSATVIVPRGLPLTLIVNGPDNYGIPDAAVELLSLDSKLYSEQKGTTDFSGKFVFEHVSPGYYQVNVKSERHDRWSRNVQVGGDKAPDPVRARLVVKARR